MVHSPSSSLRVQRAGKARSSEFYTRLTGAKMEGAEGDRSLAKNLHSRNEAQKHRPTQRPLPTDLVRSHTHTQVLEEQCQELPKESEGIWSLHCPRDKLFPSRLSAIVETMMTGREGGRLELRRCPCS